MKTEFVAKLENGATIKDNFYFSHRLGKGVLSDLFKNWVKFIGNSYHVEIQEANYNLI